MTMAYKGIIGRDTGVSIPMNITCVVVAAGCSAVGIGRQSAGIGLVISGEMDAHGLKVRRRSRGSRYLERPGP